MRSLVFHGAGDLRVEERPAPAPPAAGEVLLTITRAGLCGTDASEFKAGPILAPVNVRHPASGVQGPITLGHEFIGIVERSASERFATGTRVAAGAGVWCGRCAWCRRGQTNLCDSYWTFGLSADGGLAQNIVVPDIMLHAIPDAMTDDNAALAQPLAVGLHAVDRSGVAEGDIVVVNGAGAIGSFIIAGLQGAGVRAVVAIDVDDHRLAVARQLGADVTVNASTQDPSETVRGVTSGSLADVVIEASGIPGGLALSQQLTRRGGNILLVGLPRQEVEFDASQLILREVDVRTTSAHVCDRNLPAALRLLGERDLTALLVEAVVPLDRVVTDALQPMIEGTARGKFLVDTQVGS